MKYTYEEVKYFVEVESDSGCKLLSGKYINNNTKMTFHCKCGNDFKTTFAKFKSSNKRQCNQCSLTKYDYNDVKIFIENESDSNCKLLDAEYKNTSEKLSIRCGCGEIFQTAFRDFKYNSKRRCNKCSSRKFSYEEVKNFIEIESGSDCELLSENYKGISVPLNLMCTCGKAFTTTYNQFKNRNKRQCNECGWKRTGEKNKYSFDYVKKYIESNTDMKLVSDKYSNSHDNISVECGSCGVIFQTTFSSVKNNNIQECSNCSRIEADNERRLGYEYIKAYIENNSKCKILTPFKEKMLVIDDIELQCECGEKFMTSFTRFKDRNKRQCSGCGHKKIGEALTKSPDVFEKEVYNLFGYEYTLLSKYENAKTKVKVRHNKCEYEWELLPNALLIIKSCPQCAESKGEQRIREYLENKNLKSVQEYSFEDLLGVGGGLLRFDFAIFDKSNLKFLIEYDGEFHYQDIYEDGSFETIQIHDKRKNEYCKNNNTPLLRIPYWEFDNIEAIIDEWLYTYGL